MNKLEIFVLNKSAGVFTEYGDIPSVLSFLHRAKNFRNYRVIPRKGERSICLDDQTPADLIKKLTEFDKLP